MTGSNGVPAGLLYVGRLEPPVVQSANAAIVDDWDAKPRRLDHILQTAPWALVMDPFSFPWDSVDISRVDVPFGVFLGPDRPADAALLDLLGAVVFGRLSFYDRVLTPSDELGALLTERFKWSKTQVQQLLSQPIDQWQLDEGLVDRLFPADRQEKAILLVQKRAIQGWIRRFSGAHGLSILHVGARDGRWTVGIGEPHRYTGLVADEDDFANAVENFPGHRFHRLQGPINQSIETHDMILITHYLGEKPRHRRREELGALVDALRPGGALAILEEFEPSGEARSPVGAIMEDLASAGRGALVISDFQALQQPGNNSVHNGFVAVSKLGAPVTL